MRAISIVAQMCYNGNGGPCMVKAIESWFLLIFKIENREIILNRSYFAIVTRFYVK